MSGFPLHPLSEVGFRFRPLLTEYGTEAGERFGWFVRSLMRPLVKGLAAGRFEGYVAQAGRRTAGIVAYAEYRGTARISLLHGGHEWRNRGVEERLLDATLADLRDDPARLPPRRILSEAMMVSHSNQDALWANRRFSVVPRLIMRTTLERPATRTRMPLTRDAISRDGRPFRLRGWQAADVRPITEVLRRANGSSVDRDIYPELLDPEQAGAALRGIAAGSCGRFDRRCTGVATTPDGASIGVVLCSRCRPGEAFIVEVAVAPDWQGRGVGTALVARALELLASRGVSDVSLGVTRANAAALRLYERTGFWCAGEFGSYSWTSEVESSDIHRPA